MAYKQIQCFHTAQILILEGVPTGVNVIALQAILAKKMEKARQKMVTHKPLFYGLITKVPLFVLDEDYEKNTPYAERSENNDIPFWSHTPFHMEYVAMEEEHHDQILAGMV
jgi:hypothetical protein